MKNLKKSEKSKVRERNSIKQAKREFVRTMRKTYKGFTEKQWASTSYREKCPQSFA